MFGFRKKSSTSDFLDFLNARYDSKDSDQDGLTDEVELLIGTDPYNADTDGDGMNDREEIECGRNPLGTGKLKDFFIPHQGNDYMPSALKPQRLVFYGVSSILIKLLVAMFVLTFPMVAWLSPDILQEQAQKIINLTNELRETVGVNQLIANPILSQAAYDKARDMLLNQYFAHTGNDGRSLVDWLSGAGYNYAVAGENLAMGFAEAEEVMTAWQASPTHYANLIDPDFSEIGVGMVSGPFGDQEAALIAQYFAYPNLINKAEVAIVSVDNNVIENNISDVVVASVVEGRAEELIQQVLSITPVTISNEVEADDYPRLIAPVTGEVFNQSMVNFKVWAPSEGTLRIYDNKELIEKIEHGYESDYSGIVLDLVSGQHNLQFKLSTETRNYFSPIYEIGVDLSTATYDAEQTELRAEPIEGNKAWAVRFKTVVSDDVTRAILKVGDYTFNLDKQADGTWFKQGIVYDEDLFDTMILANLMLWDEAGNQSIHDIEWSSIPQEIKMLDKYAFLSTYPSPSIKSLLDVSSLFYRILLVVAIMALGLNVFIEIKKQRPKLIASAISFIALLAFLIIF